MAAPEECDSCYVELSKKPIKFDPVSRSNNVFFDDTNRQVFCVQSTQGKMKVMAKGPDEKTNMNSMIEDRGDVVSIKFSKDYKTLGIQRSPKSVEFINFLDGSDSMEYSQSCKGKTTRIIGFCWTDPSEIVFITDHGLEYYQVLPDKKSLKSIKTHAVNVNWFVWLPQSNMLLLSSGALGNTIYPFVFRPATMVKLPKFDVELPVIPKPAKLCLLERDVIMANMDNPGRKTDVLRLDMSGRFAINVIDNLIVVHHQALKKTLLFDIKLGGIVDGGITYHNHIVIPRSIKSQMMIGSKTESEKTIETACDLYSANWIVFQPNIIIDAKIGYMWYVQLSLEPIVPLITDKCALTDFLLLRRECKFVVLGVCKQMLSPDKQADLATIAAVFDRLNSVYAAYLLSEIQAQAFDGPSPRQDIPRTRQTIIDQSDMYTHVFTVFVDTKDVGYKFVVAVLVEYIRSLNQHSIVVQHYLYELIINTLVHNNSYYQLHQFLQYHVISDSKPLACLLLSLESCYHPAYQLALDMLKRLSTANEEIIEVFLSKQQLLAALRFVRSVGAIDSVSARKFLDAAKSTNDNMLFYTVYKFFEQRNVRLRGSATFPKGEHCDKFVKHFEAVFGIEATEAP